jgi:heat shock protein HslJ
MMCFEPAVRGAAAFFVMLAFSAGYAHGASRDGSVTSWVLRQGQDIPSHPQRAPQLRMEGQKLSGSTGCNSFTATVSNKDDKRVAIENVGLTRMLCASQQNKIEAAFVRALGETVYLEEEGKRLTFLSDNRRPLLVWTRNSKSAKQPVRRVHQARAHHRQRDARVRHRQRDARVRHHQRDARVRHRQRDTHARHRQRADVAHRGCWDSWTRGTARRARVF